MSTTSTHNRHINFYLDRILWGTTTASVVLLPLVIMLPVLAPVALTVMLLGWFGAMLGGIAFTAAEE